MSEEASAAFDRLAPQQPIDVAALLPAAGARAGVLTDAERDAAIAAVLRCWLVEDKD